jgi:hypothetical protein
MNEVSSKVCSIGLSQSCDSPCCPLAELEAAVKETLARLRSSTGHGTKPDISHIT